MPQPEKVYVILFFKPKTLQTLSVRGPTMKSIYLSFGENIFSGLGAIEFAGFLWPSLVDLDL